MPKREAPIRSPAGRTRVSLAHRSGGLPAGDPQAGFVLLEAVAALAITLLLLAFVLPLVAPGTTPPRLLALVSSSVSLLREARTAAIAGGKPVAARFDSAQRRLWSGGIAVGIPADVAFSLTAGGNCPGRDGATEIQFRPDGSNCGGVLRFVKGHRTIRARVDWADGHVDVVEGG